MMVQRQQRQDRQSKAFYELSALVLNILRSPPPQISFSDSSPVIPPVSAAASSSRRSVAQITPGGFASLLLGISLAMMFCGSITFFIGFFLMPWVLGLVMFLYVAGIVSCISMLGRSVLCYATGPPPCPQKEIPSWKLP